MKPNLVRILLSAIATVGICSPSPTLGAAPAGSTGLDSFSLTTAEVTGNRSQVQARGQDSVLRITPDEAADTAQAVLEAPEGVWDLSSHAGIAMTVRNLGRESVMVRVLAENPGAERLMDAVRTAVEVLPGEERDMTLQLARRPENPGYDVFEALYM